jgi:hypothetical protein
MSKLYDEFMNLILSRPNYEARGFINVNCPACGDSRQRGGFLPTSTGGFRYSCYNGGCTFSSKPTGWEAGNGLNGRVRQLFNLLGGDISRIPGNELMRRVEAVQDNTGKVLGHQKRLSIVGKFTPVVLPRGTIRLEDAAEGNTAAEDVMEYLYKRSPLYLEVDFPFMWAPKYPKHLIVPFIHFNDKIVGYMGRDITKATGDGRFIQRAPADYMFNQHTLSGNPNKYVFVVESPMDAILLRGVATKSNKFTEKQINLLKVSRCVPILVPDQLGDESEPFYTAAKENGWPIAVPDWPYKDAGESINAKGLLYTIEALTSAATTNYMHARGRLGITT